MQTTTLLYTSEWIKKYRFNLLTICSYKRVTELGRKFHVLRGINHGALAYSQKLRHKSSTVRMISIHYDNRNYPATSFRYSWRKWPSSYDCSLWSNLKSRSRLKYDFILNGTSKHIVWIKMKKKKEIKLSCSYMYVSHITLIHIIYLLQAHSSSCCIMNFSWSIIEIFRLLYFQNTKKKGGFSVHSFPLSNGLFNWTFLHIWCSFSPICI